MKKWFTLFLLAAVVTAASAFEFNRQPAGLIKGARQSYVSGTAIKIGVGYGEIMGSYWEITPTDPLVTTGFTLTGLTATASGVVHYLYIDRTNSSLPNVSLRNSTTAPVWSDDFMGWYDGVDRCIGALWVLANGNISDFYCPDDSTYEIPSIVFIQSGGVPASYSAGIWTSFDVSPYTPANVSKLRFAVEGWATSGTWSYCTMGFRWGRLPSGNVFGNVQASGVRNKMAHNWFPLPRGESRVVQWMAYASSSTGQINRYIMGYEIER
jgi:hypothetical protein